MMVVGGDDLGGGGGDYTISWIGFEFKYINRVSWIEVVIILLNELIDRLIIQTVNDTPKLAQFQLLDC